MKNYSDLNPKIQNVIDEAVSFWTAREQNFMEGYTEMDLRVHLCEKFNLFLTTKNSQEEVPSWVKSIVGDVMKNILR